MMNPIEVERHDLEAEVDQEQQQGGGHRINRRLIGAVAGAAIIVAIAAVAGIKAAGSVRNFVCERLVVNGYYIDAAVAIATA